MKLHFMDDMINMLMSNRINSHHITANQSEAANTP